MEFREKKIKLLTIVVFVAEISNKHFCKLDKILTFVAAKFLYSRQFTRYLVLKFVISSNEVAIFQTVLLQSAVHFSPVPRALGLFSLKMTERAERAITCSIASSELD